MYDLFAICNHYGRTGFGHYTAFARDWREGTYSEVLEYEPDVAFAPWYHYDDESVTSVQSYSRNIHPPHGSANGHKRAVEVEKDYISSVIKTNSAYILFYRLRENAMNNKLETTTTTL